MPIPTAEDAYLDTEDWAFTLTISDPDTGLPRNLAGSDLKITFRSGVDGSELHTASTEAEDGSLTILSPATDGKVAVLLLASDRTWRAPVGTNPAYQRPVFVIGDLLRRPSPAMPYRTEGIESVRFLVRPSTTQW